MGGGQSSAPEATDPYKSQGSGKENVLPPTPGSDEYAAFQNASAYDRNPAPEACPRQVVVSGAEDVQKSSMGTYVKTSTLSVGEEEPKPIYQLSGGFGTPERFLYYWQDYEAWRIGPDYSSVLSTITTPRSATFSCPSLVPAGSWLAWTGSKFTPYPNITVIAEESKEQTWQEFYGNNIGVLAILLLTLTVFVCLHVFERRWRRKTKILEQMSDVMHDAQQFSVNLVRHFMPTMSVEKYQFRGMKSRKVQVDIAFKDLGLTLPSGASVLEGVTGEFKAGKLCAILGPSGAGKTTFMNALCGKASYGTTRGEVLINGVPGDISSIQSVTGFVPQDDIVHEQLTVREQIRFSAELRNEVGTTKRRLDAITEDVLNVMQLLSVQGSIVGGVRKRGISGGQRKRVNVGLELAAQPTVLFLDEPTSGLDSTSSLAVVLSLKKMCELGMTSIMVIHQPRYSLFTLFSEVLLLGKGGHTVYLGPSTGAKAYFENLGFAMPRDENPADWFMDVICGEVNNSFHSNFTPPMLWEWWNREIENRSVRGGRPRVGSEFDKQVRQMDDADDRQMLAHHLDLEWESVDTNRDGVLDFDEMKLLMATCARQVPSDEVVKEIMQRMSKTPESVTKQEFIEFLMCLRRSVAEDMAAIGSEQSRTLHDARAGRRNFAALALQSIQASRGFTASGSVITDSDEDSGSDDESDSDEHGELTHNNSPSKASVPAKLGFVHAQGRPPTRLPGRIVAGCHRACGQRQIRLQGPEVGGERLSQHAYRTVPADQHLLPRHLRLRPARVPSGPRLGPERVRVLALASDRGYLRPGVADRHVLLAIFCHLPASNWLWMVFRPVLAGCLGRFRLGLCHLHDGASRTWSLHHSPIDFRRVRPVWQPSQSQPVLRERSHGSRRVLRVHHSLECWNELPLR